MMFFITLVNRSSFKSFSFVSPVVPQSAGQPLYLHLGHIKSFQAPAWLYPSQQPACENIFKCKFILAAKSKNIIKNMIQFFMKTFGTAIKNNSFSFNLCTCSLKNMFKSSKLQPWHFPSLNRIAVGLTHLSWSFLSSMSLSLISSETLTK